MNHNLNPLARSFLIPLIALAACSESIAPENDVGLSGISRSSSLLGSELDGVVSGSNAQGFLVTPALRLVPLAADVAWSFVAGPLGVTSTNPATGLTIEIPAGALSTTETITVTALAGPLVAYRFEPHGLQFDHHIALNQSLSALATGDKHLRGAYFPDDVPAIDPLTGLATVTELEPTKFDKKAGVVRIKVRHFSGYLVASGNSGAQDGEATSDYQ